MALLRVWGLRSAIQNWSAATTAFHIEYSLANDQYWVASMMKSCGEVSVESWNDTMYIFFWGFTLVVESISVIGSKWCSMDPNWWTGVSGMYTLICWHMPYVHLSSKVKVLLCLNGYQLYTWWCVKWLFVFQSKSIKLFRDAATGPNLSLTTDVMCLLHVPWILVVSNDPDAGTAFDCMSVASVDSVYVGSHSICRTWFFWGFTIGWSSLAIASVDGCCLLHYHLQ